MPRAQHCQPLSLGADDLLISFNEDKFKRDYSAFLCEINLLVVSLKVYSELLHHHSVTNATVANG